MYWYLTGCKYIPIQVQLAENAKAPLIVIPFPNLIIVLKCKDGNRSVITASTIEVEQCRTFICEWSNSNAVRIPPRWPTRSNKRQNVSPSSKILSVGLLCYEELFTTTYGPECRGSGMDHKVASLIGDCVCIIESTTQRMRNSLKRKKSSSLTEHWLRRNRPGKIQGYRESLPRYGRWRLGCWYQHSGGCLFNEFNESDPILHGTYQFQRTDSGLEKPCSWYSLGYPCSVCVSRDHQRELLLSSTYYLVTNTQSYVSPSTELADCADKLIDLVAVSHTTWEIYENNHKIKPLHSMSPLLAATVPYITTPKLLSNGVN